MVFRLKNRIVNLAQARFINVNKAETVVIFDDKQQVSFTGEESEALRWFLETGEINLGIYNVDRLWAKKDAIAAGLEADRLRNEKQAEQGGLTLSPEQIETALAQVEAQITKVAGRKPTADELRVARELLENKG